MHAAWVLSAGGSIFAVSRRLGHASITITADISGYLTQESDDAMRAITSRFTLALVPGGQAEPGHGAEHDEGRSLAA